MNIKHKYGDCLVKRALEDIRRLNRVEEAKRVAAHAAFCREKLAGVVK